MLLIWCAMLRDEYSANLLLLRIWKNFQFGLPAHAVRGGGNRNTKTYQAIMRYGMDDCIHHLRLSCGCQG